MLEIAGYTDAYKLYKDSLSDVASTVRQCQGTTVRGDRCLSRSRLGHTHCSNHESQDTDFLKVEEPVIYQQHTIKNRDVYIRLDDGTSCKVYRVIAALHFQVELTALDVVHHIDGDHYNNHPDNLQIADAHCHNKWHGKGMSGRIPDVMMAEYAAWSEKWFGLF